MFNVIATVQEVILENIYEAKLDTQFPKKLSCAVKCN